MKTMYTNASRYDWPTWMLGIMRSFLSGGASALMTGGGGAVLGIPRAQVWELMAINFIFMGLYRLGEFLKLHGAPDAVQVAQVETTTKVTPTDESLPVTETKTTTPVMGPALVPDKDKPVSGA